MKKYINLIILFVILSFLIICVTSFASTNANREMIFRETLPEGYVPTKTEEELSQEYDDLLKQHANTAKEREELWQKEYELKQEMIDLANYYKSINYTKELTYGDIKEAIESKQAAYGVLIEMNKDTNNSEGVKKYEDMMKMADNYLEEIENIENTPQTFSLENSNVNTPNEIYNNFINEENTFYDD